MKWSTTLEARIEDNMQSSLCRHGGALQKRIAQVSDRFDSCSRMNAHPRVRECACLLVMAFSSSPPCRVAATPATRQGYAPGVRMVSAVPSRQHKSEGREGVTVQRRISAKTDASNIEAKASHSQRKPGLSSGQGGSRPPPCQSRTGRDSFPSSGSSAKGHCH
jgi:hypothetical protein